MNTYQFNEKLHTVVKTMVYSVSLLGVLGVVFWLLVTLQVLPDQTGILSVISSFFQFPLQQLASESQPIYILLMAILYLTLGAGLNRLANTLNIYLLRHHQGEVNYQRSLVQKAEQQRVANDHMHAAKIEGAKTYRCLVAIAFSVSNASRYIPLFEGFQAFDGTEIPGHGGQMLLVFSNPEDAVAYAHQVDINFSNAKDSMVRAQKSYSLTLDWVDVPDRVSKEYLNALSLDADGLAAIQNKSNVMCTSHFLAQWEKNGKGVKVKVDGQSKSINVKTNSIGVFVFRGSKSTKEVFRASIV